MISLKPLAPLSPEHLRRIGWDWLFTEGNPHYMTSDAVALTEADVEALYLAGNSLYTLLTDAAEHVIRRRRLSEMGIPERMHTLIRETWEDERHWHLIGRFDLAGGVGGAAPRLIEFNADTPTCVPEASILQWALLKANGMDETRQCNRLYEALVENYGRWRRLNDDLEPTLLLTGVGGMAEDDANLHVHAEAAREAGFRAFVRPVDEATFDAEAGVFVREDDAWVRCDFVFKLIPWETILAEEPELYALLERIIRKRLAVVANPPYALLLQSKRLLKVAYELNPGDAYLLETDYASLTGKRYVEKPAFGREGGNVAVYHGDGTEIARRPGDYDVYPFVYQEFVDLPHDAEVRLYQTGLFHVHEPCAVIFRRGGLIIDDQSPYVAHYVAD